MYKGYRISVHKVNILLLLSIFELCRDLAAVVQRAERDFGVNMYAVGVGGTYNLTELQIITHNHSERIFTLDRFDDLHKIVDSLETVVFEGNKLSLNLSNFF